MVFLQFVYKGSIVSVTPFYVDYTKENLDRIRADLSRKKIPTPENYDRFELVNQRSDSVWVG